MKTVMTLLKVIALVISIIGALFLIRIFMNMAKGGFSAFAFMPYDIYSTVIFSAISYVIAWILDRQLETDDTVVIIAKNVAGFCLISIASLYICTQIIY